MNVDFEVGQGSHVAVRTASTTMQSRNRSIPYKLYEVAIPHCLTLVRPYIFVLSTTSLDRNTSRTI